MLKIYYFNLSLVEVNQIDANILELSLIEDAISVDLNDIKILLCEN